MTVPEEDARTSRVVMAERRRLAQARAPEPPKTGAQLEALRLEKARRSATARRNAAGGGA